MSNNKSYVKTSYNTIDNSNLKHDSSLYLPDVNHFKQNIQRAPDLELEERAVMNLYAQDYDDLKLLSMLKSNPDLYHHKLEQYKNKSQTRIEAEKELQKQRLDKIKLDFTKQKYEEERKIQHERWLENENVSA